MELRGADSGPMSHVLALPALFVGLLYDTESRAAALELVKGWTGSEIDRLRHEVCSASASALLRSLSNRASCVLISQAASVSAVPARVVSGLLG